MSQSASIFSNALVRRLLVGARVAISLINPGNESTISNTTPTTPTPTTPTFLPPTRCTPSPSSEPTSFPFVAAMGYVAIVVTVILFCICRPTSRGGSATPPTRASTPRPDPSTHMRCSKSAFLLPATAAGRAVIGVIIKLLSILRPQRRPPRLSSVRTPWMSVFRLFVLILPVLYVLANTNVTIGSSLAPSVAAIEQGLINGWSHFASLEAHIRVHGLRYLQVGLTGIASHILAVLILTTLLRLWSHLSTWDATLRYCLGMHMLCVPVVASICWLDWIIVVDYYFLGGPTVDSMNQVALRITTWKIFHVAEVSTALGIGTLHAVLASLCMFLYGLRTITKILRLALSSVDELEIFLSDVLVSFFALIVIVAFQAIRAMITIPICWYITLSPALRQVLRDSVSSRQSRKHATQILLASLRYYREWKARQIGLNAAILSLRAPWKSCFEIWNSVPIPQKILIVAPAIILYGYVYIIPIFRKFALRVRYWRRQRR
ncbi:hypothetical protein FB45DRAFT_907959, partial [Roridomyces roridus]